jgi:folate-binding protein YgfZ
MGSLYLRDFHQKLGVHFTTLNGVEVIADYGNVLAEHTALSESAAILDLGCRGRLCLTGMDRVRFLHGQVTNDIKRLTTGEGCYAALVTAKGRMEADLNIYQLPEELLLDFEPGLTGSVSQRLERYIIADDVQVVDIGSQYGLLSVQGLRAERVIKGLALFEELPVKPFGFCRFTDATMGEVYLVNRARVGTSGFDLFIPNASIGAVLEKLLSVAQSVGGRACGTSALEMARIENGIPRFGIDMDETNFPQECGIESQAVSYTKGCYVGQEVLNRIHTLGHVNRKLCGLKLGDRMEKLPARGDKLFQAGREVGYVTSALASPRLKANIALGHVRKEANSIGTELVLQTAAGESDARVIELPFQARA